MGLRASRFAPLLILAVTLAYTNGASATVWQTGDETTYTQIQWDSGTPATLLSNNFATIYPLSFEVGSSSDFFVLFGSATDLLNFLPQTGTIGQLDSSLINPLSTDSGAYGGEVAALKLNVDFSGAGLTLGSLGTPFGDLILSGFDSTLTNLNGMTVDQFLADDNTCLGGGACIDSVADLYAISVELNGSFAGPDLTFADDHLVAPNTVSVPEPVTLSLFGAGLAGMVAMRRRKTKKV